MSSANNSYNVFNMVNRLWKNIDFYYVLTKIGLIVTFKHGMGTHWRSLTYVVHDDVISVHIWKHRIMVDMS